MAVIAEGVDVNDITYALMEFYDPGQSFTLELNLNKALNYDELSLIADELSSKGMDIRNITAEGTALKITSTRPSVSSMSNDGYGLVWWIPVAAIAAVVFMVGAGIISWRLMDAISENFMQFMVVMGIFGIAGYMLYQKRPR